MLKRLTVVFAFLLSGCATVNRVPTDYAGQDAGKVVLGMGATAGTSYSSYSLLFRKKSHSVNEEKATAGRFTYFQTNVFYRQAADYQTSAEGGVVLVQSLPPGVYEIYNFDIFFNAGTVQNNYGSRVDFSIPFTVKPGQTTYLGNYQANKLTGKNFLGLSLPAGAVFVVTDRLKAELPIAEAKIKSALPAVQDATPQPNQIGNPFFTSAELRGNGG
jgi:hypothetical protein